MALGAPALLPAVLTACATQVDLPALPATHPAHPAATAAEPIRPSDLLERAAPLPAAVPAATGGHDHHAHGTGDPAAPGRPPEGAPPEAHEPEADEHAHGEHPVVEHEGHEPAADEPAADEHETDEHDADAHEPRHDPPTPPTEHR